MNKSELQRNAHHVRAKRTQNRERCWSPGFAPRNSGDHEIGSRLASVALENSKFAVNDGSDDCVDIDCVVLIVAKPRRTPEELICSLLFDSPAITLIISPTIIDALRMKPVLWVEQWLGTAGAGCYLKVLVRSSVSLDSSIRIPRRELNA